ncbi:MAG: hypothetical protein ABIC82_04265 [bacterium]
MICRLELNKKNIKSAGLFFLILFLFCGCSLFPKKAPVFDCKIFSPTCGEDETTYYNQCQAEENNVKVNYDGACNGSLIKTIPYEMQAD